jgi:hypothetical protein
VDLWATRLCSFHAFSSADCAKLACVSPITTHQHLFNETGLSGIPDNDIIVSMGGFRDRHITPSLLAQGGAFMHELGHNLGLNHGGPIFNAGVPTTDPDQVKLNFKPTYLSVMNYNQSTFRHRHRQPQLRRWGLRQRGGWHKSWQHRHRLHLVLRCTNPDTGTDGFQL